jgi:GTPase
MSQNWNIGEERRTGLRREKEYAILVGLIYGDINETVAKEHLDELAFLALTAGAEVAKVFTQRLPHPDTATFIGKGKVEEVRVYLETHPEIGLVIFDDDLTGKQMQHLERDLKVKIIDRSSLILDIFADRAQTAQARTQVELAQMQYLLPRLRGLWTHLERQRGGIGMRGPGEKEIETDRRIVRYKISLLKEKLVEIDRQSQTRRKNRDTMIRVALVGYTNVGKSTLMNVLSKSDLFAENKLFATLDTTVRKVVIEATPFLLSDTVGFIRKLPHHLVESFKSTLDEVRESDILVHVLDVSHPQYEDQLQVVTKTLEELGSSEIPTILVFNKMDAFRTRYFDEFLDEETRQGIEQELLEGLRNKHQKPCILLSAQSGENMPDLKELLLRSVREQYVVRYPHEPRGW